MKPHRLWLLILLWIQNNWSTVSAGDGNWGEWSSWSGCSTTCGQGQRRRYRACDDPPPTRGGDWCPGKHVDIKDCAAILECPVDGGWTEWNAWSSCSVSCGEGRRFRHRSCTNPEPRSGGAGCEGKARETQSCFVLKDCPRDGKWSSWSQWSGCSVTCGEGGSRHRYRSCNNPAPSGDGLPCPGSHHAVNTCNAQKKCAVNGHWSEWSEWTPCSVTCGSGEQQRWRMCDNPPPQYGGNDCNRTLAGDIQIQECSGNVVHCPVEGGWSEWTDWGLCNTPNCRTKASASSLRQRSCNNPLPAHQGKMCQGVFVIAGTCTQPVNCKVDGGWSEWSGWSCTRNIMKRTRRCDKPPPSNGGKPCPLNGAVEFVSKDDEKYRENCKTFISDDEDLDGGSGSGAGIDPRTLN